MNPKIAFLDYQLPNWHANTFRDILKEEESQGILHAATSQDHESGAQWAAESEVSYVKDIRELRGAVDGVMVLAPSNPETHLELVTQAVELGVPLYVDKTFAPSLAEAQAIFDIADKARVPLFSTSALRCADELTPLRAWGNELLQAQAYGGGGNFAEYVIHPLEILISLFGANVTTARVLRTKEFRQITLEFADHGTTRVGTVFCYPKAQPFFQIVAARECEVVQAKVESPIFKNLTREIVQFFETGKEPVRREQTLKMMELIEQFTKQ